MIINIRGLCAAAAVSMMGLSAAAPAHAAAGWQGTSSFTFVTGEVNQQIGYNCPSNLPIAHSGAFAFNSVGQTAEVYLSFNGPRIDIGQLGNWAWHFYFPSGAPAGTTAQFNVYCAKT